MRPQVSYTSDELGGDNEKYQGVIAASAGNHALALAYHGRQLGVSVTVVMPRVTPATKLKLCRHHGARVFVLGNHIGESKQAAMMMAETENLLYINGYDHIDILAGSGTIGIEIMEDVREVDAIVIPVGGGGLIAGIACAAKELNPQVKIIGVESESCPSFQRAREMGRPSFTPPCPTIADGLAVPVVGVNAYATANHLIDKLVIVSEEDIYEGIFQLIHFEKEIVEGAGSVGLAAIIGGHLPELRGKRVVIPLCGANIDTKVISQALLREMVEVSEVEPLLNKKSKQASFVQSGILSEEESMEISPMWTEKTKTNKSKEQDPPASLGREWVVCDVDSGKRTRTCTTETLGIISTESQFQDFKEGTRNDSVSVLRVELVEKGVVWLAEWTSDVEKSVMIRCIGNNGDTISQQVQLHPRNASHLG